MSKYCDFCLEEYNTHNRKPFIGQTFNSEHLMCLNCLRKKLHFDFSSSRHDSCGYCSHCHQRILDVRANNLVLSRLENLKCRSRESMFKLKVYMKDPDPIKRPYVPDELVKWNTDYPHFYPIDFPDYKPLEFTRKSILNNKPDWADSQDCSNIKWNQIDEANINRKSHLGTYFVCDGRPRNPIGRTGITGRGRLGRWGPNHAGDCLITRYKRDENGNKILNSSTNKFVLQFIAIKRNDTGEWAMPGGMCEPNEDIKETCMREFMEEATNSLGLNESERKQNEDHLKPFFEQGQEIYKGYVDDPRNTDNAWMETIVFNFHDENDVYFKDFKLNAGDDAGSVAWMDIDNKNLNLYASHKLFLELAAQHNNAHWDVLTD